VPLIVLFTQSVKHRVSSWRRQKRYFSTGQFQ